MVKLLDLFISCCAYLNRHWNRNRLDLISRYRGSGNQAPWALVTGASDGLGAHYCRQLARDGFNICLVSRTMSKLKAVEAQIKKESPQVKTKIVQVDFDGNANIKFYRDIKTKVKDLEIKLLVLNAACHFEFEVLKLSKPNHLKSMLEVNLYQYVSMLRQFLPIMAKKKERCGVILVSSAAALSPQPMNLTYSAIKAAISSIAAALYEELKEEKYRVDLMCYMPGVI